MVIFIGIIILKKYFFYIFKFKICDRIIIINVIVDNIEIFGIFKKIKYIMKELLNNYGV